MDQGALLAKEPVLPKELALVLIPEFRRAIRLLGINIIVLLSQGLKLEKFHILSAKVFTILRPLVKVYLCS